MMGRGGGGGSRRESRETWSDMPSRVSQREGKHENMHTSKLDVLDLFSVFYPECRPFYNMPLR